MGWIFETQKPGSNRVKDTLKDDMVTITHFVDDFLKVLLSTKFYPPDFKFLTKAYQKVMKRNFSLRTHKKQ